MRLNALVDGELPPADSAELAARLAVDRDLARAYATLAQLKATVGEIDETVPAIVLPPGRRRMGWRVPAIAACVAVLIGLGVLAGSEFLSGNQDEVAEGPTAITLAALPAGTSIPRLDAAGLKLVGLAIDPGKVPLFTATYRGPHGCRLELRAWHIGAAAPALIGTSRQRWQIGDLTYELVAHGMPSWRFALIADAAEQQTRLNANPDRIAWRLRQAAIGAPPCLG